MLSTFSSRLLLALIVWTPIPLGSNRTWSLALFDILAALTFAGAVLSVEAGPILRRNALTICCAFIIPVIIACQLLLPAETIPLRSLVIEPANSPFGNTISLAPSSTCIELQKSVALALIFTASLILLNTPQRLKQAAEFMVASGVFQATYGVMVAFGGKKLDLLGIIYYSGGGSATGTYPNRDHLAGYLEMTIAAGVGLLVAQILQSNDPYQGFRAVVRRILITVMEGKARLRIFLALMVIALVLTHSRAGNGSFYISLGICALIGLRIYSKSRNRASLALLFFSLIAVDVLILSAWFGLDQLSERLQSTDTNSENRFLMYPHIIQMIKDEPLGGYGAGSFPSISLLYHDPGVFLYYSHAHNDYMELLVDYGPLGVIPFVMIVLLSLRAAVLSQTQRQDPLLRGIGFAAMMGIISLLLHSLLDFNLQIPANAMTFTLLCAMACAAYTQKHVSAPIEKKRRKKRNRGRSHDEKNLLDAPSSAGSERTGLLRDVELQAH